ncbi:PDR/VanB family oxidoreductase [Streptomyces gamaensis]|uniref:PDR/VanB family oxidoreductase n=1 Tax=Streptomyces gamaensis TaxID=1763542 RepID=A0ABW0YXU1_9ACTN
MAPEGHTQELLVRQATLEAEGVLGLELVSPSGKDLPEWDPGAHIELVLPSGLIRQYSLCGDPQERGSYRIAVLREREGRGGSEEIHTTPLVGMVLRVRGPRNRFPLVEAGHYVFIAGGIGITPVLAMLRELRARDIRAGFSLLYGGRSLNSMAFRDELRHLCGDLVSFVPQDVMGLPDIEAALAGMPSDTVVYCCGPEGLLRAVEDACDLLLPDSTLHVERFTPPARPSQGAEDAALAEKNAVGENAAEENAFEVELRRTGTTVEVPPCKSILQAVREAGVSVPSSCEQGHCGTCETAVLAGTPLHRDTLLTDEEREASETMMICVGRSRSEKLVLDL